MHNAHVRLPPSLDNEKKKTKAVRKNKNPVADVNVAQLL